MSKGIITSFKIHWTGEFRTNPDYREEITVVPCAKIFWATHRIGQKEHSDLFTIDTSDARFLCDKNNFEKYLRYLDVDIYEFNHKLNGK